MRPRSLVPPLACATFLAWGLPVAAQTTTLASVSATGAPGNHNSRSPTLSADGRFVVFESQAEDLYPGLPIPSGTDIYRKDRWTGDVVLVNVSQAGIQGTPSEDASVSADGQRVAFVSRAALDPADTNGFPDVYLRDLAAGTTTFVTPTPGGHGEQVAGLPAPEISSQGQAVAFASQSAHVPEDTNDLLDVYVFFVETGGTLRVSVSSLGEEGNGHSFSPSISADGRYVAFSSRATNLDDLDAGGVFRHDVVTGETVRVSVDDAGNPNATSVYQPNYPSISDDGRYVAFEASDPLDPGDTNTWTDVYLRDLDLGKTRLISARPDGVAGNAYSFTGRLSRNGRYLVFESNATDLAPGGAEDARTDVFLVDLAGGPVVEISRAWDGSEVVAWCALSQSWSAPTRPVSDDGLSVAFYSKSPFLVMRPDTNSSEDVFLRSRGVGQGGIDRGRR